MFLTLLQDKLVTLGLYRLRAATDNEYPYVYTNPHFETIVTHRDRVFVLGLEVPQYLEGDVYHPLDRDLSGKLDEEKKGRGKGLRFNGIRELQEREDIIFDLKSSKYRKYYQDLWCVLCRTCGGAGASSEAGAKRKDDRVRGEPVGRLSGAARPRNPVNS